MVFTHGSQDWNVKPLHVFNMFQALPTSIKKHLFYHNGAHVYLNNWQSIDFRESMNALLSKKLLGYDSSYELPTVIWQDNTGEQSWTSLDDFGNQTSQRTFSLGDGEKVIQNRYETKDYERYGKAYPTFLSGSLPRQGPTGDHRSSNRRRPAPQRESSPSPATSLQHQ